MPTPKPKTTIKGENQFSVPLKKYERCTCEMYPKSMCLLNLFVGVKPEVVSSSSSPLQAT